MDGHAQQRNLAKSEHHTATIPATVDAIDARIAEDHRLAETYIDSGQTGIVEWYVQDIERLTTYRRIVATGSPTLDALVRMRLRGLSQRYSRAVWADDMDTAERLKVEIERLERGQM